MATATPDIRVGNLMSINPVVIEPSAEGLEIGADGTATLLVVTDDRELRHGARLRGARTAGSAWLIGRLGTGRLSSPSVGNPRPARTSRPAQSGHSPSSSPALSSDGDPAEMDRPRWKSGRGATTKRGNPKRAPKAGGTGRMPP